MFADPAVVKVLHGSDSDVVWLQVGAPFWMLCHTLCANCMASLSC